MEAIGWIVLILLGLAISGLIYFIPSLVAKGRKHFAGIFVLNFFLGWTLFFWVGALIWALCDPKEIVVKK